MVKYAQTSSAEGSSLWDRLTPVVPYLRAAGIGAGIGALGGVGAGVGAGWERGDWKRVLKSALIGMIAGTIAGPTLYGGYQMLFPAESNAASERTSS
jgi:hypothetical protein